MEFGNISDVISGLAALGAAIFAFMAVQKMETANDHTIALRISELLQSKKARRCRREVVLSSRHVMWHPAMNKAIEDVCWRFDVAATIATSPVTKELLLRKWGHMACRCWAKVRANVEKRREDRGYRTLWKDFECLAHRYEIKYGLPRPEYDLDPSLCIQEGI